MCILTGKHARLPLCLNRLSDLICFSALVPHPQRSRCQDRVRQGPIGRDAWHGVRRGSGSPGRACARQCGLTGGKAQTAMLRLWLGRWGVLGRRRRGPRSHRRGLMLVPLVISCGNTPQTAGGGGPAGVGVAGDRAACSGRSEPWHVSGLPPGSPTPCHYRDHFFKQKSSSTPVTVLLSL